MNNHSRSTVLGTILGFILLTLSTSCSLLPCNCRISTTPSARSNKFALFQANQPSFIWSPKISDKIKQTLRDYKLHKTLPNGLHYGDSVRNLNLEDKTADQITTAMTELHCKKRDDSLQNPKTHAPLQDSQGKKIPLTVFLCPDGGVVRVKPAGDPTSRFRTQPQASKSLRYPFNAKFESFDDEVVKVDQSGQAIPKWTKDLNPVLTEDPTIGKEIIEGWANDAHTDLK